MPAISRLRVFDMEGQPVIICAKVETLTGMLGDAIGEGSSPQYDSGSARCP
jgi:hypothetical protein